MQIDVQQEWTMASALMLENVYASEIVRLDAGKAVALLQGKRPSARMIASTDEILSSMSGHA